MASNDPLPYLFGRIEDRAETEMVIAALPQPFFSTEGTGAGQDVFLWKAEEAIKGTVADPHHQTIGDCVSHGFSGAIDVLRWVRMAWEGMEGEDFIETASEAIYAGARVQIGGGRCGTQDGAVGAWALKWVLEDGIVPRANYGPNLDLTQYSGARARQWGMPRAGCPQELIKVAREYPLKTGSLVTSYEQVRDAIAVSKSPVTICSNQGFEPFQRGPDGFIKPGGTWPHCMMAVGVTDNPKRPGIVIRQSWGKGMPSGPLLVTLPHGPTLQLYEGMFLVDAHVINRMTAGQDSYSLSDMIGYPRKEMPFLHFY